MSWQLHEIMIPLFIGALVMLVIVLVAFRRRQTPGALPLAFLSLALSIYTLGYAGELGSRTVADVLTWLKIEYIGIVFLEPFMVLMVLDVSGGRRYFSPPNLLLLFAIPVITLSLAWTAEYHDWIWQDLHLVPEDDLYIAEFSPGIWYQISTLYTIILIVASFAILLRAFQRATDGIYRRQLATILGGTSFQVTVYIVYVLGILATPLDINPFASVVTASIMAWALFQYQLFDVSPVARETLLAGMRDGVIVTDTKGRVVDMNQTARRALNRIGERIAGQPLEAIFAAWPDLVKQYRDVYEATEEITVDLSNVTHTYEMGITPLRDHSDRLRGRLIILTDVTARVQAEKALKQNLAQLVTLRDIDTKLAQKLDRFYVADVTIQAATTITAADVVAIVVTKGEELRVLAANGVFPALRVGTRLKHSHSTLIAASTTRQQQSIKDCPPPCDQILVEGMHAQLVLPLVANDKFIGLLVLESTDPNGISDHDAEMLTLLAARAATAMDNANLYEERVGLIAEQQSFSHTVAHDLKNPLHSIVGYIELLQEELVDRPSSLELAEQIEKIAHGAVGLIDNLLMLARVRGAQDIEIKPLDMKGLVANAASQLNTLITENAAVIETPEQWENAVGYAPWIEVVWVNYISNAIKYGGKPPRVKLGSRLLPNNMVCFWVEDNGKGLTDEEQTKLFQPFTRLNQTRVEGHGLGLSIVHRIIERLGGEVGVESATDTGSRFYFTLPATTTIVVAKPATS